MTSKAKNFNDDFKYSKEADLVNPHYNDDSLNQNLYEYFKSKQEIKHKSSENRTSLLLNEQSSSVLGKIQYISIDYLLKLILIDNIDCLESNYNKLDSNQLILYFLYHHTQFMETRILISKVDSIYDVYSNKQGN